MDIYNRVMALSSETRIKLLNALEPIAERDLEEGYRQILNDIYGTVSIAGNDYDVAEALESVDPVAYRCGYSDWLGTSDSVTEIDGQYYDSYALEEELDKLEDETAEDDEESADA